MDVTAFHAGGTVAVVLTCETATSELALLGIPGTRTFTTRAVEVIDTYRGDP